MKIEGPLYDAVFLERPNRFLTKIEIDGKVVESHLPDPGRLKELLIKGARLRVRKVPETAIHRRTKWTTVMVKSGKPYISLDTTLPNKLVKRLLENKELPFLKDWNLKKTEVTVGKHRFDFLLENKDSEFFLEVKSVTLVENGVAMFPDAVTERGKKHMEELSKLRDSGFGAAVLIVCQRSDVRKFTPHWERDSKFASSLLRAKSLGVKVWVIVCEVTSTEINYKYSIPYILEHK